MKRGDVYDARLSSTEGSEQTGIRPVIIVSRDTINQHSPVIVIVPLTNAEHVKRSYPNDVPIPKGAGGLAVASVALGGQVRAISKTRLLRLRGSLSGRKMQEIDRALRITLDL
ncbi:MAG: type II toxin-antitoxin system PemK/MazF family toxin [Chloroflexi bacterium]|nr:type II toxin-antitoxin system PemK/MazF family toxin [Chloroflexota bacterium]MCI0643493.1 type II toxin-antitoxin system PemK/MazF family toxin [Chloroflexota bacterium]MCI0728269.1 type II toxin-antitoxin system PemK/MazF family toxin [Chloroflexota bacterium]